MSSDSPDVPKQTSFRRKMLGKLKNAFHSPSSSRSSSPQPSAPNSEPSVPNSEPSPEDKLKQAGKIAWAGLRLALQVLEKSSDIFPPLKSAVGGFNACLSVIEDVASNRKDHEKIATELKSIVDKLNLYAKELTPEDTDGTLTNITVVLKAAAERIAEKQKQGMPREIVAATQYKYDVMDYYRQIEAAFRQLQIDAGLWTLRKLNRQRELGLLENMKPVEEARYNSAYGGTIKRRGCTIKTREQIQQDLQEWVHDSNAAKIYWMNGMAGTGKTTIAYTLCQWLETNKKLGANFFCSRTKESYSDVSRIIPTVACQLGRHWPCFRSALCSVLERDPGFAKLNVVQQFEKLIKDPLFAIKDEIPGSVVVVIDALDECADSNSVRLVIETLMRFAAGLPLKFFVASRPEHAVRTTMLQPNNHLPAIFRLHDIEESIVAEDIEKYLREAFETMQPGPSDHEIKQLASHSGKLFIYAATVVRYVCPDDAPVDSIERLATMLAARSHPGNNTTDTEMHGDLNNLYSTILRIALNRISKKERRRTELVLWTAVCAKEPLTMEALALLLDLTESQVSLALGSLQSVLHVSEGQQLVSTLHASFPDYMLNKAQSDEFFCDEINHSHLLANSCFDVMRKQLRFNICRLKSSFVSDVQVPHLEDRIKNSISEALFYACRYWSAHLQLSDTSTLLTAQLDEFLSLRLLFWMEVLNINGCIVMGMGMLHQAQDWLQITGPHDNVQKLVVDANSFVTRFAAGACKQSTPHIYISALSFCPRESLVYKRYWGHTKGLIDVKGTAIDGLAQNTIATWITGSAVNAVAISSNGKHIASGSGDRTIRVWDAQTGNLVAGTLQAHTGRVNSVVFSPDGKHIVSGSSDRAIRVWDAQTGDLVAGPFQGHAGRVYSVAFSPNGKCIVSGSDDRTIRVWDAQTGDLVAYIFGGHTDSINSVAFSSDGNYIISGSSDETVRVWDTKTGNLVAGPFQGHTGDVNSVAFSLDSKYIVSGSYDCTIRVWDAQTGELVAGPFRGHTDRVNSVAFSPNGKHIVSSSDDHTIRVWNAQTGDLVAGPLQGHTHRVYSVVFSPDGRHIISGSSDETIRVWGAQTGDLIAEPFQGHTESINSVAFSPESSHIVSGSSDRTIRVWDAQTGNLVAGPFQGHTGKINSVAFSSDGKRIVSGSSDRTIRVWDAQTGDLVAGPFQGHTDRVNSAAFSPNGKHIVSGSSDRTIRVWDAHTGDITAGTFQVYTDRVNSVAFSPDSKTIVSGSSDRAIHVWDAQTGNRIAGPFQGHIDSVNSAAFSPNGRHIVSGSDDKTIRVWDVQTGELIAGPFQGHTKSINSVAFSPEGSHIVSGSSDQTVCVWGAQTGGLIAGPFQGHTDSVNSVAFSPDSNYIVSSSSDSAIRTISLREKTTDPGIASGQNLRINLVRPHNWGFRADGWITLNDEPYLWISPDVRTCFPSPLQTLAIGLQGSIYVDSWNILVGDSWSQCYILK